MQANGAERLRLACCLATERGIEVCAPIHDALLVHAPLDRLDDTVRATQQAMADASRLVLSGFELRTDVKVVRHPDRYMDKRGAKMWQTVCALLAELEAGGSTWAPVAQNLSTGAHPLNLISGSHP